MFQVSRCWLRLAASGTPNVERETRWAVGERSGSWEARPRGRVERPEVRMPV
jgi:hypothetical protein